MVKWTGSGSCIHRMYEPGARVSQASDDSAGADSEQSSMARYSPLAPRVQRPRHHRDS